MKQPMIGTDGKSVCVSFANVSGSLIPHQWESIVEELRVAKKRIAELEAENQRLRNETWNALE